MGIPIRGLKHHRVSRAARRVQVGEPAPWARPPPPLRRAAEFADLPLYRCRPMLLGRGDLFFNYFGI